MTTNEDRLKHITDSLTKMGARVRNINFVDGTTYDERLESSLKFLESFLSGDFNRIFMFDNEDDPKGWLFALQEAWNLADKNGNDKLSGKIEEIIDFHMNL